MQNSRFQYLLKHGALTAVWVLVTATPLMAQDPEKGPLKGMGYFPVYIVVGLLAALGMFVITNSMKRLDDEKDPPKIHLAPVKRKVVVNKPEL